MNEQNVSASDSPEGTNAVHPSAIRHNRTESDIEEASQEMTATDAQAGKTVVHEEPVQALALPLKQQRAVAMLIAGATTEQVAQELGVHRSTVWAWKQQEPFQAYYNITLREQQQEIVAYMKSHVFQAANMISACMGPGAPWNIRLRAAQYTLDTVMKQQPGATDPRELVREHCRGDEEAYRRRCEELGIDP